MLEIKNLSVGYGLHPVLEGVDATFDVGKLTAIVGINGSGKSTLLRAMLGIISPTSGGVLMDGVSLSDMSRREIAKKISYLSQGKNTPDMTVMQMVLHGRFPYLGYPRRYSALDKELAYFAMEKVGICDLADRPLATLSGGMRQNAYIAMALAQDTEYILLDEPTTYLDIAHQLELMQLLRSLADEGRGVVAVMHDLPMAFDYSDNVTVIANGKIAVQTSPSKLCDLPIIEELFGVRLKHLDSENKYYYVK